MHRDWNPFNSFLMVKMASGMDHRRVRPTTTTTNDAAQHDSHPANTKSCTGSPHIRLEQTTFIGRVLCFVLAIFLISARNARSGSARSGTEITKSLGACSEI